MPRPLVLSILSFALILTTFGCTNAPKLQAVAAPLTLPKPPPTRPSTGPSTPDEARDLDEFQSLTKDLGGDRSFVDGVYSIVLPRNDLNVMTQMGNIPVSAGLASQIHLFRCTCGKLKVVGEFIVVDYELNKVIEAVSTDGKIDVVSVSGMFFGESPRMISLRFQGEGEDTSLIKTISSTLSWIGEARSTPQPIARPDRAR